LSGWRLSRLFVRITHVASSEQNSAVREEHAKGVVATEDQAVAT
jgi:hypothetical protein